MPKNKYSIHSLISEHQFRRVAKYFAYDLEASKIASLTGLSRPTVNKYFKAIRIRIAGHCKEQSPFKGEIEVDESYFGPRRQRGMRGRGAAKKIPVFGILKRNGKVYTKIVEDVSRYTLQNVIKGKVDRDSVIHSDGFFAYDGLVDIGYKKHYRVKRGEDEFAKKKSHINGIENFWRLAKVRLSKFRRIHKHTFYLNLKECEARLNYKKKYV